MRNLQSVEIAGLLDLLAEPAAHLAAGIAGGKPIDVVLLEELVHQLDAAAVIQPGILLARIEAERHAVPKREGRILADEIVGRGMAHLDGAVGHRVGGLQRRHDLAGGKDLDLELVVASPRRPIWRTSRRSP